MNATGEGQKMRFREWVVYREKKARNYLAMLHFACVLITFRAVDHWG
jgi:hypothetical protein